MNRIIRVLIGAALFTGCSVPDSIRIDQSEYDSVYKLYKSAEENKSVSDLRAVAEKFADLAEKYPSSGILDDSWLTRGKALVLAADLDSVQSIESAKSEYEQAIQAFEMIPQKSSKYLASHYYHGFASYRIWGRDSTELVSRSVALDHFFTIHRTASKHDNAPGARYYSGHIYRKSSPAQYDSALVWFDLSIADTAVSSFAKAASYWGGTCADSLKDTAGAIRRYSLYLALDPAGTYAENVQLRLEQIDPSQDKVDYAHAYSLYTSGDFSGSIAGFESYISNYPSETRIDDARYYLARSCKAVAEGSSLSKLERANRYVQAISIFQQVKGDSTRVDMSRYYAGSSAYDLAKLDTLTTYFDTAIVLYRKVLDANKSFVYNATCSKEIAFSYRLRQSQNLDSALIWFEKCKSVSGVEETGTYWGAVTLQDMKRNSEATGWYKEYVSKYSTGSYLESSLYGSAYCTYLQADTTTVGKPFYTEAINLFDSFIQKYGSSDLVDNARLYGGHCYRKLVDRSNAASWYEWGVSAGDGSKKGDCAYWAGVQFDILSGTTNRDRYLNQYVSEYDKGTSSFDDATYYADSRKRLGL